MSHAAAPPVPATDDEHTSTLSAWSDAAIRAVHDLPLPELLYRAQTVHRAHHDPREVQLCTLLSIKTG
ncbi:MAG: biotin synthase BioB, partial [Acidobacteriota bacterium]